MQSYHFFTGENSISTTQRQDQSFGRMTNVGTQERYNLENKFSVSSGAPVFAIVKSMILALPNMSDPNLINMALIPIEQNHLAGFPIKFIIFRGIDKASIIDANDEILQPDLSWNESNILKLIHDLQTQL